jgi:N-acetylmuramoyl-L-alanine amidase
MSELTLNGKPLKFDRPSPNSAARPAGVNPCVIVLHSTGGSMASASAWLRNADAKVSAHFLVSRTGVVEQLVSVHRAAWHAGKSAWRGRPNVNAFSIGIEMEHVDNQQDWTPAQLEAVATLCRALMTLFHIPAASIVSHASVATPAGRKIDPAAFPWAAFREMVGG